MGGGHLQATPVPVVCPQSVPGVAVGDRIDGESDRSLSAAPVKATVHTNECCRIHGHHCGRSRRLGRPFLLDEAVHAHAVLHL